MPAESNKQNYTEIRLGLNEWTGCANRPLNILLPPVLEDILRKMGAYYRRDPVRVQQGLHADDEWNRGYLGTYFPRSYSETSIIWSEMLAQQPIRRRFQAKRTLHIASFGSGTGGDVVGTLCALEEEGMRPERVIIHSFDGNADALAKQRQILGEVVRRKVYSFPIEFNCRQFTWGLDAHSFRESCEQLRAWLPKSLDMVQASKWLIEFYIGQWQRTQNLDQASGIVREWLRFAESIVDAAGLVAISDLTTRDCGHLFPMVLNGEATDYLADPQARLRAISPIPCALRQGNCPSARNCYTRRAFCVTTGFCVSDPSQLCYRAFAPMEFAQDIIHDYRDIPYRVSWNYNVDCQNGRRGNFIQGDIAPSGFSAYCRMPGA